MDDQFRHLHMPADLACLFLALFSRMEYALKATPRFALEGGGARVTAGWDRFANSIDGDFCAIEDASFVSAVNFVSANPPRIQVIKDGVLAFADQVIDENQTKTQQVLLSVRVVRNNLFHGGKHLPDGEEEVGRNAALVRNSLTILEHCSVLHDEVRARYEY